VGGLSPVTPGPADLAGPAHRRLAGFPLPEPAPRGHDDPVPSTLRVLIVDDHEVFRRIVRRILEDVGFDVVGEAGTGAEAFRLVDELGPDVVLLDVQLPDTDGFLVAEGLSRGSCPPAVVLISTRERSDFAGLLARSSARGFVTKADLSGAALHHVLGQVVAAPGNGAGDDPRPT
jgi:CheY-like chemotaxis protein